MMLTAIDFIILELFLEALTIMNMNFLKMIKTTKLNRFGDFIQANLTVVRKKYKMMW